MPVIAAIGVYMGATSLIAGGLTILETIAAIGAVVGGIGTLTGNEKMAKIGAVAGLAGGIGAFAQSKGWLAASSATETAANAATEASAIDAMQATPSGAGAPPVDPTVTPPDAGGAVSSPIPDVGPVEATNLPPASEMAGAVSQQSPEIAKALGAAPAPVEQAGGGLMDAGAKEVFNAAKDSQAANVAMGVGASERGGQILELFDTMFRDKDGKLNKEMLSLAGNFIGGAFDQRKAAETDLLNERAASERTQRENANAVPTLNLGVQRKPGGPFRPTSPVYNPVRPTGLFNAR